MDKLTGRVLTWGTTFVLFAFVLAIIPLVMAMLGLLHAALMWAIAPGVSLLLAIACAILAEHRD